MGSDVFSGSDDWRHAALLKLTFVHRCLLQFAHSIC